MGILDDFLKAMHLNDEDDFDEYDDDDLFDDEYDEEEEPIRKSPFRRGKKRDENFDEEPDTKGRTVRNSPRSKVTPMQSTRRPSMEVCVIKPTTVNEAREVVETLLSGCTIILNLEGLDIEIAQRIIDFTSGAAVAIDGNLQKISNFIFLVTPTNVDISGDLQDLLNSSFDEPSIRTRY